MLIRRFIKNFDFYNQTMIIVEWTMESDLLTYGLGESPTDSLPLLVTDGAEEVQRLEFLGSQGELTKSDPSPFIIEERIHHSMTP